MSHSCDAFFHRFFIRNISLEWALGFCPVCMVTLPQYAFLQQRNRAYSPAPVSSGMLALFAVPRICRNYLWWHGFQLHGRSAGRRRVITRSRFNNSFTGTTISLSTFVATASHAYPGAVHRLPFVFNNGTATATTYNIQIVASLDDLAIWKIAPNQTDRLARLHHRPAYTRQRRALGATIVDLGRGFAARRLPHHLGGWSWGRWTGLPSLGEPIPSPPSQPIHQLELSGVPSATVLPRVPLRHHQVILPHPHTNPNEAHSHSRRQRRGSSSSSVNGTLPIGFGVNTGADKRLQ